MIATHTPKMFNARIKSSAVLANREIEIPNSLICSQTTKMRKELWAAPRNSADMKKWRNAVDQLPDDALLDPSIPDISDPQLKQLLLPKDWHNDRYVSVTPVSSMGLLYELYERLYEQKIPFRKWIIQPTPAALANHGESLLKQGGAVRMLRRGPFKINQSKWRGDFVQMTARVEGMNISSGMVALGFPAITAIGGYIHSLERKIGQDIEFAIGIKHADWVSGVPKISVFKSSYGTTTGRAKGGKIDLLPGYSTEEVVANCEIVLLLRTKDNHKILCDINHKLLCDILESTHRLAGGRLFGVEISTIENGFPPEASYLQDMSHVIATKRKEDNIDSLQAALDMYAMGGQWEDGEWQQLKGKNGENSYILNQTGYAFLENPTERKGARGNYLHAWSEPTFSLIKQSSMNESCWWSKNNLEAGMFWKGKTAINS